MKAGFTATIGQSGKCGSDKTIGAVLCIIATLQSVADLICHRILHRPPSAGS